MLTQLTRALDIATMYNHDAIAKKLMKSKADVGMARPVSKLKCINNIKLSTNLKLFIYIYIRLAFPLYKR